MIVPISTASSAMRNPDFEQSFRALWESNADRYRFFHLARFVAPHMTMNELETGWQKRMVLHEDYETAKQEFVNLLCGAW